MNTVHHEPMYRWDTIRWKRVERVVFKLQKRIYRAQNREDVKRVRKLQRLLMTSWSAKLLAVRRVTQDNRGKNTAGVDGVKSLTPTQRLPLACHLRLSPKAAPVRRVLIPKPGTEEQRPLGIPTLGDRARQSLVKMALEPQWETIFEPNSYGFRPGRSAWDAIGAIYVQINQKPKWVLDADIAKCFDRINHNALLKKVGASPTLTRQLRAWLQAGVMDNGQWFPTEEGTPQGGTISPLLANIALHGLEQVIKDAYGNSRQAPTVIRYADDLVVLSPEKAKIEQSQEIIQAWLKEMGLELKPSKTRITHTLKNPEGEAGCNFLGFNIKSYPTKRTRLGFKTIIKPSNASVKAHHRRLREIMARHKTAPQAALIKALNGVIRGWSQYFSTVCSKETYRKADGKLVQRLRRWVRFRHPKQPRQGAARTYWRRKGDKWHFSPSHSDTRLGFHSETRIKRHVKIQGNRSPYDGDWVYWSTRLGRHPGMSPRVALLLKRQDSRCAGCGLHFTEREVLEVDHILPKSQSGKDVSTNWQLLHGHCHDGKTAEDRRRYA